MPRDIPVSNSRVLICFDKDYQIRDFYYPHVGQENHAGGYPFRFGVWVDGHFSWVSEPGWQKELKYKKNTLVTDVKLINHELGLELNCNDFVDYYYDIYVRVVNVKNLKNYDREVHVFFHHDYRISGTEVGDTGIYNPYTKTVVHYKGNRYFLCGFSDGGVEHYSIGAKALRNAEGTWRDAEDGHLQNTPVTQGSVDSTIGKYLKVKANDSASFDYWICSGKNINEVNELNGQVIAGGARTRMKMTQQYWDLWVNKEHFDLSPLPDWAQDLFNCSLLIVRTQCDHEGSILAANDSDIQFAYKDHYSYLWPRDGALVAQALDQARYESITQKFYSLVGRIITPEGYLLHKYNPDGSLASSWHPWIRAGKPQLPIQEDETALVLWGLWEHFKIHRDVEFVRSLYRPLISRGADFLLSYRDPETHLPLPSFDLWEERRGVMTFTCCTVEAGLRAAANFAEAFGDEKCHEYREGADQVKEAILKHLYDPELGRFLRGLVYPHDHAIELLPDSTVDASLYALFRFGTFSVKHPCVKSTMQAYRQKLWVQTEVGGIARYQYDYYQAQCTPSEKVPGNPWVICTLWLMMEEIFSAETEGELVESLKYLEWVHNHSSRSGVLAEQINPFDGKPLSVAPLTWSHATVVEVVMLYLKKVRELRAKRNVTYRLHAFPS
jgi:GH15 family glucan-1,4-alpha-glucosidase